MPLTLRACTSLHTAPRFIWLAEADRPPRSFVVLPANDGPRLVRILLGLNGLCDPSGHSFLGNPSKLQWLVCAFWGDIEAYARRKYQPPQRVVLLSADLMRDIIHGPNTWRWTTFPAEPQPSQPAP